MSFYPAKRPDLTEKANAQVAHAKRRAVQRLGEEIDTQTLAKRIQTGNSRFMGRQSHRVSYHEVLVGEKRVLCVYDNKRKVVVTVWSIEKGENNGK